MITTQNVVESLARGFIPMVRSKLFEAKVKTIIKDVSGRNEDASTVTFNLFARIAGSSIGKVPVNCGLASGYSFCSVLEHPILLNPGDSIDGDCQSGTSISFEVIGFAA